MSPFIIVLSVFRTIFAWCLPLCVVGVILADYRQMRRNNVTLASLRVHHRHSLAHYHVLSLIMLSMTCITYWVVAGSPADMFFLSTSPTNTPYFAVGFSQSGFDARFLLLPTFAVFISLMMFAFWSAAVGNGPRLGLFGMGGCTAAFILTCLVLVWGEIGTRQRDRCYRFCPAGRECGCNSFWRITLPLVIIEFLLLILHAFTTYTVWRRVRGYSALDEKTEGVQQEVDMEAQQYQPEY